MIEIGLSAPDPGWLNGPGEQARRLIDAAYSASKSVPYEVNLRWVFYRLWQAGTLAYVNATPKLPKKVNAYVRLKSVCTKAVHFGILSPDWVIDDTRSMYGRSGESSIDAWLEELMESECEVDWWSTQSVYLMIAFEADAMRSQFEYYTEEFACRMWPMRGDPSNAYKLRIAKVVDGASRTYGLPVVILYFGDLDEKGLTIPEAAFRDIHAWSTADLKVYRVGLNPGDEERFNMPDIPGKPGCYQWEALEDEQARELIEGSVMEFLDWEKMGELKVEESKTTDRVQELLLNLMEE